MFKAAVNLLRGEVTGRVESGFPERILNLCAAHAIPFRDVRWESEAAFTFTVSRRHWKKLRRLTGKLDCRMQPLSWRGAPFFLGRLRRRYGLWVTMALCALALSVGSFFVWDVRIEGAQTVPEAAILRALEEEGVGFGSFGYGVNSIQTRNALLLKLPQLSYIAVNVRGCRAWVQVRERVEPPEMLCRRGPGNTVAEKDGLVTAVQPWGGEKQVLPGTTVRAGQLLISGVVHNDFGGVRWLQGMGKVYARTWYDLECAVPLTVSEKVSAGRQETKLALILGKKRINLYFSSSHPGDTCDKMIHWNQCELPLGIPLPVTVVRETVRPCTLQQGERSREEALALAKTVLTARLQRELGEGEVLSLAWDSSVRGDMLYVTLAAECEEQIGKFVEIPKE